MPSSHEATARILVVRCAIYARKSTEEGLSDSIHLPPNHAFHNAAGYYGTALHELAHWTGHPSRLDRATLNETYRFGDVSYAKEELRAELASVFLAAERGIPHDPEQHAAYVGSWIKTLKEDKNEIFRAAHDASRAADFLLALERDRSIASEVVPAAPPLDPTELADPRNLLPERQTKNRERDRRDREAGLAPSAGPAGRAPHREMLGRARSTGGADSVMQPDAQAKFRPLPIEFEMAYQIRVAIDRIRFVIKATDQFAHHPRQVQEAGLQLLDALDRLESAERGFQRRFRPESESGDPENILQGSNGSKTGTSRGAKR